MKVLHTSDWHVGKTIRGHSRASEHTAVLDEIVAIATTNEVDLVVVAGDLFDTASPTAESEQIVYRALLGLRTTGAQVMVVAGNHDNPNRLAAVAPVLGALDVHVVSHMVRPAEGGVVEITVASGERVRVALMPFLSQRGIVRADDLMAGDVTGQLQKYADRYRKIVAAMCEPLRDDMVNVVVAHAYVERALSGGGERAAHIGGDYAIRRHYKHRLMPLIAEDIDVIGALDLGRRERWRRCCRRWCCGRCRLRLRKSSLR